MQGQLTIYLDGINSSSRLFIENLEVPIANTITKTITTGNAINLVPDSSNKDTHYLSGYNITNLIRSGTKLPVAAIVNNFPAHLAISNSLANIPVFINLNANSNITAKRTSDNKTLTITPGIGKYDFNPGNTISFTQTEFESPLWIVTEDDGTQNCYFDNTIELTVN